jgi:hypothetical protein
MNARRTLSVTLAALVVSTQLGSALDAAAPSARQIAVMQDHLSSGNYGALAVYLAASPDLLSHASPLSQALGDFLAAYRTGSFDAFSASRLAALETLMAEACRTTDRSGGTQECSIY